MIGLPFILVPLGLYVILVGVIAPILLHRKAQADASHALLEISPDDPGTPAVAKAFFQDVSASLESLGFRLAVCVRDPRVTADTEAFIFVFWNTAQQDAATALITLANVGTSHLVVSQTLDLGTDFADGTDLHTCNADAIGCLPPPSFQIIRRFPGMADLGALYRVHQLLRVRYGRTTAKPLPTKDECLAQFHSESAVILQRKVQAGHAYHDLRSGLYRLTWKGAVIGAWLSAWPVRQIRSWWGYSQAQGELRRLGLSPNYVRAKQRYMIRRVSEPDDPGSEPIVQADSKIILPPFCPQCDYNLSGLRDDRCPECGRPFNRSQLQQESEQAPQPITRTQIFRLWIEPIGMCTLGAIVSRALMALANFLPDYVRELRTIIMLLVLIAAYGLVWNGFLSCREVARRLAVNRALRQGGERSGRKDRGFTAAVTALLYSLELSIGIALLVFILIW